MVKHGADGFIFEVLEYCEGNQLDEREANWIETLKSLYPKGYNLTSGGGAFQKHNEETKKIFSENQKNRYKSGVHLFASTDFQEKQRQIQIERAKLGLHPSQSREFKEKRNATVQERIKKDGKFFGHKEETIERKKIEQQDLYSKGLGKFQQPELIERNRQLVKEKLAKGLHHTQQEGWTEKNIESHAVEMKEIVLCVRSNDGQTITSNFRSINDAARVLVARKKSISEICHGTKNVLSVSCKDGRIIRGSFGSVAPWTNEEVEGISINSLTRKMSIEVTILIEDGSEIIKRYESQRGACLDLDANHRAIRFILKEEKYKSTRCNLGRIIKVREV